MTDRYPLAYSVVVPVYDEQDNVVALHAEIVAAMNQIGGAYEIIFVDDGSTDATFDRLDGLAPIKIIRFRKNFGQTAALDAGFQAARGKIIITLDGDQQNNPADIPLLLEQLAEGYDVVSGWRWQRHDPQAKNVISRGANFLRRFFVKDNIHDSGCSLKAYRRECFENFSLFGEMHRFIPAMLRWQGYRVTEVKVSHRPRAHGTTKYGWKRIVKGFVDMISVWFWRKYANRPLHLFGGVGVLAIFIGSVMGITLIILRYFAGFSLANRIWPLVAVFLVLAGIQLFVSGLLADILIKIHFRERPIYQIKEVVERPSRPS